MSGWGTLHSGGSCCPDKLMKVAVPIVKESTCKLEYPFAIAESMICAGEPGKDSCQVSIILLFHLQAESHGNILPSTCIRATPAARLCATTVTGAATWVASSAGASGAAGSSTLGSTLR